MAIGPTFIQENVHWYSLFYDHHLQLLELGLGGAKKLWEDKQ